MSSARNVIIRSLLISRSPETEVRRRMEIRQLTNPIKRMTALALHEVTVSHPQLMAKRVGVDLDSLLGVEYVGAGVDSVVFKKDNMNVVKIHQRTLELAERQQCRVAHERQAEYEAMADYLARFVLPQSSFVDVHPFIPTSSAVQTTQPYRKASDTNLFSLESSQVNPQALDNLFTAYPLAAAQLPSFIEASLALYDDHRLLPDTRGNGNLLVNMIDGGLLLIDGQPTAHSDVVGQTRTLAHLDNLNQLLSQVA